MKLWTPARCPSCGERRSVNNDRTLRTHPAGVVDPCPGSGQPVDCSYEALRAHLRPRMRPVPRV